MDREREPGAAVDLGWSVADDLNRYEVTDTLGQVGQFAGDTERAMGLPLVNRWRNMLGPRT